MTTTSSTTSTSGAAAFTAAGLGSGLDINSIVDGLVNVEKTQQTAISNKVTTHQTMVTAYQALNTRMSAVKSAAEGLNLSTYWKATSGTSSSSNVTVSTTTGASKGTFSFTVKNLATSHSMASFGTVASTDTVVGSGSFLIGQAGAIGVGSMHGDGSLADGSHTIEVTQASAGASARGTAVADSTTIGANESINVTVNGVAKTINLTAGTYTQAELADMISTNSNSSIKATVNSDKSLSIATTNEGSAASLSIDGGTNLSALGLSTTSTSNGTDGIVKVDGVANTITDTRSATTLNSTAGTITANFSGGLRNGTSTVQSVNLGDGKLQTVVDNLNSAGAGITAAAIQVGPNRYKLQLQSSTTGSAGQISADFSAFNSTLGQLQTVNAAQDATLQVGTGANAYTITSSSNTVSGAMAGVTLNLNAADPDTTVNVTVGTDVSTISGKVKSLVDALNNTLTTINANSSYDASNKQGGVFLGNYTASSVRQNIFGVMGARVTTSGSNYTALSQLGITTNADGTFSFDQSKFNTALSSNPDAVAKVFVEGGLTTPANSNSQGLSERLDAIAKAATDTVSGNITTAINGENNTIKDLNKSISNWDTKLAAYRQQLLTQFTAMDTAVANFKSQGTWLTNAIAGLASNK